MTTYLGVSTANEDITSTVITGAGSVFGGLGPHTLGYPPDFYNFSDLITPDGTAGVAFNGNQGPAGINKDRTGYRTTYWGFPSEAIPVPADRQEAMNVYLNLCAAGKPGVPETVQASAGIYSDNVQVIWDSAPGALSYEVYKAVTSTGKKIKLGSTSNTTFDDPNAPINEHYYWVKACNGSHCSPLSDPDTGYAAGSEKIYMPLILSGGS